MLKERKLKEPRFIFYNLNPGEGRRESDECIYGSCKFEGYYDTLYAPIQDENIVKEMNHEEYFFAEVQTSVVESDYHRFCKTQNYNGVFLAFNLPVLDVSKYFGKDDHTMLLNNDELIELTENILKDHKLLDETCEQDIHINERGFLQVTLKSKKLDDAVLSGCKDILEGIRNYYSKNAIHITRMFGSYLLLKKENERLRAIKATPIPIKYCPLMIQLLKEVGGSTADELLKSLENSNSELQTKLMCELVNKVVIEGGYFDTNRPLNSCEANVLFGASETMYSAFKSNMIDAAVIVSNNLGTIITTNAPSTQGAVKRMTGLFYTSPDKKMVDTALQEGIVPVFPYTAEIDQFEGVKKAIELGYKKIAVSVAAQDNVLHEKLAELEKSHGIRLYKFGLCSTGIDRQTAEIMGNYADVIWSCASKQVKDCIEPKAIAQVGVKIPVHIMTEKGWKIVKNRLEYMNGTMEQIPLTKGDDKRILLHSHEKIKVLTKKQLHKCNDCPYPCI